MPHYPTNYYGPSTSATYHNVVTRRLSVKDWVGFQPSARFGGQQLEQKGVPLPYRGTIMEAVGAAQQLLQEFNLLSPLMPDFGIPVLLGTVGVATNYLTTYNGIGVSYIGSQATANVVGAAGGVSTTIASTLTFDGVGVSTGLRVLYYGLTTSALNGVYTVGYGQTTTGVGPSYYYLQRSPDLTNWWQFAKPKVFLANGGGTANNAKTFALMTDAWEQGNTFQIALGLTSSATSTNGIGGSSITLLQANYGYNVPSLLGYGNTSLIYPGFNPAYQYNPYVTSTGPWAGNGLQAGEYDFLAQDSAAEFTYLRNRAHRLAYRMFKMREQYSPVVLGAQVGLFNTNPGSLYQTNIIQGSATTVYNQDNIGYSTGNDLNINVVNGKVTPSRYPSSFNRGF